MSICTRNFLRTVCRKIQEVENETRQNETEYARVRYYRSAFLSFFSEWGWHGYYCAAYFSKTTAPILAERQLPVTPCARSASRPRRIRRNQVHNPYILICILLLGTFFFLTPPRLTERSPRRNFLLALMARAEKCARTNIPYYRRA